MSENEIKPTFFRVHANLLGKKKFLFFPIRNWIEGAICSVIWIAIIVAIPFVHRITLIFSVSGAIALMALNLYGIARKSVFEFLIDASITKKTRRVYHLGEVGKYENKQEKEEQQLENSIIHKLYERAKEKFEAVLDEE